MLAWWFVGAVRNLEANHKKGNPDYNLGSSPVPRLRRRISSAAIPRRWTFFGWPCVWLLDSIETDSIWPSWRVYVSFSRLARRRNVSSALHRRGERSLGLD